MKEKTIDILLVEDDEVDVMNVKRAFKKDSITNPLYTASEGLEALSRLRGSDRAIANSTTAAFDFAEFKYAQDE